MATQAEAEGLAPTEQQRSNTAAHVERRAIATPMVFEGASVSMLAQMPPPRRVDCTLCHRIRWPPPRRRSWLRATAALEHRPAPRRSRQPRAVFGSASRSRSSAVQLRIHDVDHFVRHRAAPGGSRSAGRPTPARLCRCCKPLLATGERRRRSSTARGRAHQAPRSWRRKPGAAVADMCAFGVERLPAQGRKSWRRRRRNSALCLDFSD